MKKLNPYQRMSLDMDLRDQEVTIELAVVEPDRSVGMMGWSFEDETITDAEGNVLRWELTDDEALLVADKVHELCVGGASDDDY